MPALSPHTPAIQRGGGEDETMASTANLEVLMTAYDAHLRSGDFMTCDDPRAWIGTSNRLLDACFDAGMPHNIACHEIWAAERVTSFLLAA